MKRVVKHIEQLLYKQECVVVPGLGAFIRHRRSASIDMGRGLIYPGKCEVSFNAALSQNDGLLVQSYSEAFSFGYKRAQSLLENDIQELKTTLSEYGMVQLGQIGKLIQDRSDGRLSFIPNPDHPFSIDFYGLQPVAMLPQIQSEISLSTTSSTKKKRSDIYYLPINLKAMKYGVAAAVIMASAMLIPSQKLTDPSSGKVQYQAGFLSSKSVEKTSDNNSPVVNFEEKANIPEVEKISSLNVVRTPIEEERYYVVIASLSSERQFEKYMESHSQDLHSLDNAGVIISSTYHRIYADSFATMDEAKEYLNQLAKQPGFATSWIYKSK